MPDSALAFSMDGFAYQNRENSKSGRIVAEQLNLVQIMSKHIEIMAIPACFGDAERAHMLVKESISSGMDTC